MSQRDVVSDSFLQAQCFSVILHNSSLVRKLTQEVLLYLLWPILFSRFKKGAHL